MMNPAFKAQVEGRSLTGSIYNETVLIPELLAERVIGELETVTGPIEDPARAAGYLVRFAEHIYESNPKFRASCKRASGRDMLLAFMRHWLVPFLATPGRAPAMINGKVIPWQFACGAPMNNLNSGNLFGIK